MLNPNPSVRLNQDTNIIKNALYRAAIAVAAKLKAIGELDTIRHPDHVGLYYDPERNLVAASLRWNTASGKTVRPVRRVEDEEKFEPGAPKVWPLYNLPGLLDTNLSKPILVVEGEPCADAGNRTFGDMAVFVTSAQGANNAPKTDWSVVRGRDIYIWPDADDVGRQYASTVADLVSKAGAKCVKILDPVAIAGREVEQGWDIVDAIRECESVAEKLAALRTRLSDAMQKAAEWRPSCEGQFELADDKNPFTIDCKIEPGTERVMLAVWYAGKTVLPATRVAVLDSIRRKSALHETRQRWAKIAGEFRLSENETRRLGEVLERSVERELELAAQQIAYSVVSNNANDSKPATDAPEEIEAWPQPVALGDVLDAIVKLLETYVVFDARSDAYLVALWVANTYCFDRFSYLPIMAITSALGQCGKSKLLKIMSWLSQRARVDSNASAAVIFRVGELYKPTLFLDEADNYMRRGDDLASILNSGTDPETAYVERCVEMYGDYVPRRFNTFFPKCVAGIQLKRVLYETTLDRTIIIRLKRANAPPLPWLQAEREALRISARELASKLRRAIDDAQLTVDASLVPGWLTNRKADAFVPLLAIARAAGETWRQRAVDAIRDYVERVHDEPVYMAERLLRDIINVFETEGVSEMAATDLAEKLSGQDYEWTEHRHGRPVTTKWLGGQLRELDIESVSNGRQRLYMVHTIRAAATRLGVCVCPNDVSDVSNVSNVSEASGSNGQVSSGGDQGLTHLTHLTHLTDRIDIHTPDSNANGTANMAVSEQNESKCHNGSEDGEPVDEADAQPNAELAMQIAALDNPTETGAAKSTGEIARPLDYPAPATPAELLAEVRRLSKAWQKRYWEIVADVQAAGFPRVKAMRLAWHGLARECRNYREDRQPTSLARDNTGPDANPSEHRAAHRQLCQELRPGGEL